MQRSCSNSQLMWKRATKKVRRPCCSYVNDIDYSNSNIQQSLQILRQLQKKLSKDEKMVENKWGNKENEKRICLIEGESLLGKDGNNNNEQRQNYLIILIKKMQGLRMENKKYKKYVNFLQNMNNTLKQQILYFTKKQQYYQTKYQVNYIQQINNLQKQLQQFKKINQIQNQHIAYLKHLSINHQKTPKLNITQLHQIQNIHSSSKSKPKFYSNQKPIKPFTIHQQTHHKNKIHKQKKQKIYKNKENYIPKQDLKLKKVRTKSQILRLQNNINLDQQTKIKSQAIVDSKDKFYEQIRNYYDNDHKQYIANQENKSKQINQYSSIFW